uniref:Myo-inositol/H symporter 1 n=1 Tax=Angomonas desouzai TaxID=59800 RepID=A0A0C5KA61_9TRYP|nr:myo-inositol/H symporter 1 [Angomonas desouzai]
MKFSVMSCAALGGFLFGYDTSVVNAALFQMKDHFGFSEHSVMYALIVAIALIGAFVGAFAAGFISARFGRRPCIAVADVLFIVGSVLMAAPPNTAVILVSRVIVGLAIGISSSTIPVYLAEVTSPKHRGAAIVTNTLFLTFAQFIASGLGCILVIFTGNNVGWRIAIGIGALPAIIQLIGIVIWLPESPRWLHCQGNEEKAKLVAERYEVDLADLTNDEVRAVNMNYMALIARDMRFRVFLGCMLQLIQQFSGINTIMYYSAVILQDAGFDDPKMPVILSVPLALMNALFTVFAIFTVDRFGRRTLMIYSCGGCFIVTIAVTIVGFMLDKQIPYSIGGWLFLALLAVFLACYAPGLGCIPWVVMGEIFPTHLRTTAASAATMTNWAANALVSQVFPLLLGAIGVGGTFAIICGLLLLSFIFLWFCMVETKGLVLEQIDNMFRKRAGLEPIYDDLDDIHSMGDAEGAEAAEVRKLGLNEYRGEDVKSKKSGKAAPEGAVEGPPRDGLSSLVDEEDLSGNKTAKKETSDKFSESSASSKKKKKTHKRE